MWRSLAAAALIAVAAAVVPPKPTAIKPAPIAKAVHYSGPLTVAEEGTGEISKAFGHPIWAASVTAHDEAFLPLSILLLESGSFLTADVRQRFEQAITSPKPYASGIRDDIVGRLQRAGDAVDRSQAERELRELDRVRASGPLVRPVRVRNGRRGYSVVLGFSRIDTTFATVLPSPDGRYDVLVSVARPFTDPTPPAKALSPYQRRMRDHPLDAVEAMALATYKQLFPPAPN